MIQNYCFNIFQLNHLCFINMKLEIILNLKNHSIKFCNNFFLICKDKDPIKISSYILL